MGSRSFAQVAPTSATIALNAYIYGYAGHSLVTPHAALKQLWWTDERIDAKVTRNFVVSKLRGEEREFLDRPLAFGEGLTDDSYMEWILDRAKRLFLILAEIGVPDQIFGCIDDSWDDADLPVSWEDVCGLELSYENNDTLNQKFYDTQFAYILRELTQGCHTEYGEREHIPMEHVNTLPPAVSIQMWDRVHFPGKAEQIFMRRKFALTDKTTGYDYKESFMHDLRKAQALTHEHIVPAWASYTSTDSAFVVSDFVGEHTLGSFIDHRTPAQFMRVPVLERPIMLCEWMHCLADALAFLHHRGYAHTAVRPSSILIDAKNHIAFADVGSIRTFQRGKKINKSEVYDYAAPESHLARRPVTPPSNPPVSSVSAFSRIRKINSHSSHSSSAGSSTDSSTRTNSMCTVATDPTTPTISDETSSIRSPTSPTSPREKSFAGFRNFSRHIHTPNSPKSLTSPPASSHGFPIPSLPELDFLTETPSPTPEASDIFALGCVYLDILTYLLRGKTTDFLKFRTSRTSRTTHPPTKTAKKDISFHASPEKLDAWLIILDEDSKRHPAAAAPIHRALPPLFKLVRRMLAPDPALRPSALQVRDAIAAALLETDAAGVGAPLCCAGRVWPNEPLNVADLAGAGRTGSVSGSVRGWGASGGENEVGGRAGAMSRAGSDFPREGEGGAVAGARRRDSEASVLTAKGMGFARAFWRGKG